MLIDDLPEFSAAKQLHDNEDIAVFLDEAFKSCDASHIAHALGIAVEAAGLTMIAQKTGIPAEELCHELCKTGSPSFNTVIKVISVLGLTIHVSASSDHSAA